jgi:hypothetical protein
MFGFGKEKMSNHDKWRAILLMRKMAWSDPLKENTKTISELSNWLHKVDHKTPAINVFLTLCGKDLVVDANTTMAQISKSLRDIYLSKQLNSELPLGGLNISNEGLKELKAFTKVVYNPAKAVVLDFLINEINDSNLFGCIGRAHDHDIDQKDKLKYDGDVYSMSICESLVSKSGSMPLLINNDAVISSDLGYVASRFDMAVQGAKALNENYDPDIKPTEVRIDKNGVTLLKAPVELGEDSIYRVNESKIELVNSSLSDVTTLGRFVSEKTSKRLLSQFVTSEMSL